MINSLCEPFDELLIPGPNPPTYRPVTVVPTSDVGSSVKTVSPSGSKDKEKEMEKSPEYAFKTSIDKSDKSKTRNQNMPR